MCKILYTTILLEGQTGKYEYQADSYLYFPSSPFNLFPHEARSAFLLSPYSRQLFAYVASPPSFSGAEPVTFRTR